MLIKKTKTTKVTKPGQEEAKEKLTLIEKIQVQAWLSKVYEAAGVVDAAGWENYLEQGGKLAEHELRWDYFARLVRKPSLTTLKLVEQALGVPAAVYIEGEFPQQWLILEGDLAACREAVDDQVRRAGQGSKLWGGMPLKAKIELFDSLLVAPSLSEKHGRFSAYAVGESYARGNSDDEEVAVQGVVIGPSLIMATIALWHVCVHQNEDWIFASSSLLGVKGKAIINEFPGYGNLMNEFLDEQIEALRLKFMAS